MLASDASTHADGAPFEAAASIEDARVGATAEPSEARAPNDDDARRTRLYKARVAGLRGEHGEIRSILEERVRAGGATEEEARLVREACKAMRDRECSAAVRAMYPLDAGSD